MGIKARGEENDEPKGVEDRTEDAGWRGKIIGNKHAAIWGNAGS